VLPTECSIGRGGPLGVRSALERIADVSPIPLHVRFVPTAEVLASLKPRRPLGSSHFHENGLFRHFAELSSAPVFSDSVTGEERFELKRRQRPGVEKPLDFLTIFRV
jgi:hypothetical protein